MGAGGLDSQQAEDAMLGVVSNRLLFFKYLREKQLALEAEAQLNVIELGLENQKAKGVLDRIRKDLRAQAQQAGDKAK